MKKIHYMYQAIEEAKKGIEQEEGGPFGSVVVLNGEIIGKGHNTVLKDHDPTCHGEINAIKDACKNLNTHDLTGAILYTTAAPCPMCKGAILWANIDKVYYGCTIEDTNEIGFRDEIFYQNWQHDNFEEEDREACLKLFNYYQTIAHKLY